MKIAHIGLHNMANANSGDTLLFNEVKKTFELKFGKIDWLNFQLWERFDDSSIDSMNECDLIVIGGGGLFLRDQKGADVSSSGWQWNISPEQILKIDTPLIVYGVGYNRFRNQRDFDRSFAESLNALMQKCVFFGMRNSGSINKIKGYIDPKYWNKIVLQPCPTTSMSLYYEVSEGNSTDESMTIAFNYASDRETHRFRSKERIEILKSFVRYLNTKYRLEIVCHKSDDVKILEGLDIEEYKIVDLTGADTHEILSYYRSIDIALGMRGHAQMIPFGLGKSIFSIITHDKMEFFLNDTNLQDSGIDMENVDSLSYMIDKFETWLSNLDGVRLRAERARIEQNEITLKNLQLIEDILNEN